MFKSILMSAAFIGLVAPAVASPLPAPPTKAYTAPAAETCTPTTIRVYFRNGEAMLSSHARDVIAATQDKLASCSILSIDMVALSADGRTMDEVTELASDRLTIVAEALKNEGLLTRPASARIDTDFSEEVVGRPMARQVEVTLAAYNPAIG